MCGGRDPGHVEPYFRDDHAGVGRADPGDGFQTLHGVSERGDLVLDLDLDLRDVDVDRVDPGEHLGQQERVVIAEPADERHMPSRTIKLRGMAGTPNTTTP